MIPFRSAGIALVCAVVAACAISPLGRRQLLLYDDGSMHEMGQAAFTQIKTDMPISTDPATNEYVRCVASNITDALEPSDGGPTAWEVVVFDEDTANAFALPGGKIGVHTGLLEIAEDQDQLATVLGHEVAHVLADHSNERVSQQQAAMAGMAVAGVAASGGGISKEEQWALAALGIGMQYGLMLPYSRTHESEADLIGLDLMARAGFDPDSSVQLWQNMGRGGVQPPEWMSTHPSHGTRIRKLTERMPHAHALEETAHDEGRNPSCAR